MLIHQDLCTLPIPLQAKHYLMHLQLYIKAPLLLHCASDWHRWLMWQPDVSSTCAPEAEGKQRRDAAGGFVYELFGLPVQSRQGGKAPCSSKLGLHLLLLNLFSLPGGSLTYLQDFYPNLHDLYCPCCWTRPSLPHSAACSGSERTGTVVCHVPIQSRSQSNGSSSVQCLEAQQCTEYSGNVWRLQQLHLLGDRIAALCMLQ